MKRSLTLLVGAALWCSTPLCAQSYVESFEGGTVPDCATLNNVYTTTISSEAIIGNGSLYSNPPVNGSGTRDYFSPYLNITSTSVSISYWYKLNQKINAAGAVRFIEVGLQSLSGTYISLHTLNLTKDSPTQLAAKKTDFTSAISATGVYRLVIKMGGSLGDGSVRIIVDDISINADPYYTTVCNGAPQAINDTYTLALVAPLSDNVISNTVDGSDIEPNGESMTAVLVTAPDPSVGTVVLHADGSFTFTPNLATFTGGPVTFTYQLNDNGFAPATSNIATVTINYPEVIVLPVRLISFTGKLDNAKALLQWVVAANETGEKFQILKSQDGKHFAEIGEIKMSTKAGVVSYTFYDVKDLSGTTYYKIKIINKDNSTAFSNTVVLNPELDNHSALRVFKGATVSTLDFIYSAQLSSGYNVVVYTAAGVKAWGCKVLMKKGENKLSLGLNHALPAGVYILEVSNEIERKTTKFIKSN